MMDESNPFEPPRSPLDSPEREPAPPTPGRSGRDFYGAVLGAFAGVAFALVCKWFPAEGLFWMPGGRRGWTLTKLGTGIAVGLTILGSVLGGLFGRALDRQAVRWRR